MSSSARAEAPVIGIDIGGTNMQIGVVGADGSMLGRTDAKTEPAEGLDHVLDVIDAGVQRACAAAGLTLEEIAAVGVVAPGAIDIPKGVVLCAPNLDWIDVPLPALMEQRMGRPVVLDNDVNAAAWAEYHVGAGDGRGDALGVWIGTGVGSGLILGGRIHHGDFFTAGEIGHTIIDPDGPPGFRTVEEICSRTGMRSALRELLPRHPDSVLHALAGGDVERIGAEEIRRAYKTGDEPTAHVVERSAELLGIAIANLVTMLAVGTVIIGGGMTEALGEPYLDRIRQRFAREVFPERCRTCRLVATRLAADAGLLGAALLAQARSVT